MFKTHIYRSIYHIEIVIHLEMKEHTFLTQCWLIVQPKSTKQTITSRLKSLHKKDHAIYMVIEIQILA